MVSHHAASEVAFLQSLDQLTSGSALPVDAVPSDLARYVIAVSQDMAILAAGGTSRQDLQRIVETEMHV
jgi:hypothetical protein